MHVLSAFHMQYPLRDLHLIVMEYCQEEKEQSSRNPLFSTEPAQAFTLKVLSGGNSLKTRAQNI